MAGETKTEGGSSFGPGAYLVHEGSPSEWKLRVEEEPGKITVPQLGRAAAALGPKGYRGNKVELEGGEKKTAAKKLISLYRLHDVDDSDIPEYLWAVAGMATPSRDHEMHIAFASNGNIKLRTVYSMGGYDPETHQSREIADGITGHWHAPVIDGGDEAEPIPGMGAMMGGRRDGPRRPELTHVEFDGGKHSLEKALDWHGKHQHQLGSLEFSERDAFRFSDTELLEREADIFQAGEYPDRDLVVTEDDLRIIAANTPAEIPVNIEHVELPGKWQQIGVVRGLRAAGDWLKGKVAIMPEFDALVRRLGLDGLSIGIPRDKSRADHVAVTGAPRIAGARMFSDAAGLVMFSLGDHPTERGMATMPETITIEQFNELKAAIATEKAAREAAEQKASNADAKASAIAFTMRERECEAQIERLSSGSEARFTPAGRALAVAILMNGDAVVKFGDGEKPISGLFREFLATLPPLGFKAALGGEVFGDATDDGNAIAGLRPDQVDYAKRNLPGVDLQSEEGRKKLAEFARNLKVVQGSQAA